MTDQSSTQNDFSPPLSSHTPQYKKIQILASPLPLMTNLHTPQNIATYSFLIGSLFGIGIAIAWSSKTMPQLGIFFAALAWFHICEYVVTACFNEEKLSMDAFLINNGRAYHIAQVAGVAEFLIEYFIWPDMKQIRWFTWLGFLLIIIGQTARSLAMWHAKSNFSHQVQWQKRQDHELVTTGIYSILRHPSYFGFFYWALGTQTLLQNPICFIGYSTVLHRFFRDRIIGEEKLLVKFFGKEYEEFRERVRVGIPFIY